ncbi:MAG: tRNA pseudouridine(55) synthase TruB [Thomasclavelia sp.]|jgi:tRNA pseudouridine55 synthase|nr:tRNA pseudouridine(55) synthase TruB [Thomasclavelia sp.]
MKNTDGILLINKEKGLTSHDVVSKLRRILNTKKIGHCGTLDPDATGLLVCCIGKATKVVQFLTTNEKRYQATLVLGKATDTFDASGNITKEKEYQGITQDLNTTLQSFVGKQIQTPPIYSAIKVNGKKLYEYARNNETVKIEPREIEIYSITLLSHKENKIVFDVHCSKGTYIRSLCVDIASKLGYPGHMKSLLRETSGPFSLKDAYTLDQIEDGDFQMRTIDEALKEFDKLIVDDENIVFHGKKIPSNKQGKVAICNKEGHILAIYESDGTGFLKNVRGLW